ncbi:hypothetical protein M2397_004745 [Pseudomonas sp. BIGb0381]|uniref:hypothetical protein n=1 Tax=Pseudomonas TaxID=286 RepID=UPI0021693B8F|nr:MULTISPECIES: hypothetical protein [Pseudomonas]MCS4314425.1 hypothetical protein [Pseudomonas sp. BIGb0381]
MDIKVVSVHGHGKADEEYVLLKVSSDCDLSYYALVDTTYAGEKITDKNRHVFWFPKHDVKSGDEIVLRTAVGKNSWSTSTTNRRHTLYWNLKSAVWNDTGDAATLLRLASWKATKVK